jgi:hypothetical protein
MEPTQSSETSAFNTQMLGKYPEDNLTYIKFPCTYQINQPTRCNSFTSLLLDIYVWLNMFWALPRPSSGAYNGISSIWFYGWGVAVAALLVMVCHQEELRTALAASGFTVVGHDLRPRPTTLLPPHSNSKTRGC